MKDNGVFSLWLSMMLASNMGCAELEDNLLGTLYNPGKSGTCGHVENPLKVGYSNEIGQVPSCSLLFLLEQKERREKEEGMT